MIALLYLLALTNPAEAADGFFSQGTGYRHATFGLSRRYSAYESVDGDQRKRATMFDTSILMNAPFRISEGLYLDANIGMNLNFGHGRTASEAATVSSLVTRYRTEWGVAVAHRDDDSQIWVRTGRFGGGEITSNVNFDARERGIRLAAGARGSTFGGEIQVPVGHGNRLLGARLIATPVEDSRFGVAVDFERSVRRDEPGHRQQLTWVSVSGGVWF